MIQWLKFIKYLKYPEIISRANKKRGHCFACGEYVEFKEDRIITSQLAKTWNIPTNVVQAFNFRESMWCSNCQNTFRTRQMAKALVDVFGNKHVRSLKELTMAGSFRKKKIAEINSCGNLHSILKKLPGLYYSEFQKYKKLIGVENEDLQDLSYKNDFFDVILTSDTLEHIPNLNKALKEIYRVLKPNGYHIFTTPVILHRETVDRIKVGDDGKLQKMLPDSYHGSGEEDNLVYREFGGDVVNILEKFKFSVKIFNLNILFDHYSFVFVSRKLQP